MDQDQAHLSKICKGEIKAHVRKEFDVSNYIYKSQVTLLALNLPDKIRKYYNIDGGGPSCLLC